MVSQCAVEDNSARRIVQRSNHPQQPRLTCALRLRDRKRLAPVPTHTNVIPINHIPTYRCDRFSPLHSCYAPGPPMSQIPHASTEAHATNSARAPLALWLPAAAMMLVSVISYIDRNTLALLAPSVLPDAHLTREQYGWAVSAYSIAFLLANPLWGRVLDRIGVRAGMSVAVCAWSIASVSHMFARGPWGFALARAALGLGEGAAAPGGLRTVTQTLPAASRSRGIALTYSGGSAGAILTPWLMTPVASAYGWRAAFALTGLLGASWVAAWALLSRSPQLRRPEPASVGSHSHPRPSLRDARLWGYLLCYSLGALPLGFVVYSSSLYLHDALGLTQARIGALVWLAPLGSELGIFFWGWVADKRAAHSTTRLASVQQLLPLAMLLSLPLALVPLVQGVVPVLGLFFLAMFVASAFQLLTISYGAEIFALEHAGYVAGLASGAYGAALGALMPLVGRLFDHRSYGIAFALAAGAPALGYACFRFLSSRRGPDRGASAQAAGDDAHPPVGEVR